LCAVFMCFAFYGSMAVFYHLLYTGLRPFLCNYYDYTLAQKKPVSNNFLFRGVMASFYGINHVCEGSFFEVFFEGKLGGGKNLFKGVTHDVADGAVGIRLAGRRGKRLARFHGTVNFSQVDAAGRAAEARSRTNAFVGFHQFGALQVKQQPADDHGIGVDAVGKALGCHAVSVLVSQEGEHVYSHGKAATGSHTLHLKSNTIYYIFKLW